MQVARWRATYKFRNKKGRTSGPAFENDVLGENRLLAAVAATAAAFTAVAAATVTTAAATATAAITAAATTTAPATAEAAAITAVATPTETATATRRALLARTRDVHRQGAAFQLVAVKLLDAFLGLLAVRHRDERETTGTAGELVEDDLDDTDGADLAEEGLKVLGGGGEGEVPHVELAVF